MTAKIAVDNVKNTEEKPEEQIIKDIGKLKQDKGKTCDPPTVAHRGQGTYIFISRDKLFFFIARLFSNYRAINCFFIARYKNVGTVSSMGHRTSDPSFCADFFSPKINN